MFDPDPRPSVLRLGDTPARPRVTDEELRAVAAAVARLGLGLTPAQTAAIIGNCAHAAQDVERMKAMSAAQPTKSFHHLFDGFKRPTEQTDKQHLARVAQTDGRLRTSDNK